MERQTNIPTGNADDKMFAILCMPVVDEVQWVDDIFATFQK